MQQRDAQEYEYPQGIDFIFLLPESELLCIPRLVRMEESGYGLCSSIGR